MNNQNITAFKRTDKVDDARMTKFVNELIAECARSIEAEVGEQLEAKAEAVNQLAVRVNQKLTEIEQAGQDVTRLRQQANQIIQDLQNAANNNTIPWDRITGKPLSFPPSTHDHDDSYLQKNAQAKDSLKLGGKNASDYLLTTGKAADSNLLDGIDSSGFARSTQSYAGSNGFAQDISNQNITVVKGKSGLYMGHHVTGAPSETWYMFEVMCHNDKYVFVRAVAFADNPSYVVTGFWRDNQWSGWVADYNPLLPMKVFARFVIHKDQTLGARVITGVTEDGGDGHLFLNVYDKTKDVYFTDATGAYHTLKELFQSSVDGKNTHINGINRLMGYNSGLTTNNSWNDVAWWWEHKVLKEKGNSFSKSYQLRNEQYQSSDDSMDFAIRFNAKELPTLATVNIPAGQTINYTIPQGVSAIAITQKYRNFSSLGFGGSTVISTNVLDRDNGTYELSGGWRGFTPQKSSEGFWRGMVITRFPANRLIQFKNQFGSNTLTAYIKLLF